MFNEILRGAFLLAAPLLLASRFRIAHPRNGFKGSGSGRKLMRDVLSTALLLGALQLAATLLA